MNENVHDISQLSAYSSSSQFASVELTLVKKGRRRSVSTSQGVQSWKRTETHGYISITCTRINISGFFSPSNVVLFARFLAGSTAASSFSAFFSASSTSCLFLAWSSERGEDAKRELDGTR